MIVGLGLILDSNYAEFDVVNKLLDKSSSRTAIDNSSTQERSILISYAFDSFRNATVFGNGILYLAKTHGLSVHNQLLKILMNFGLIGFFYIVYFIFDFLSKKLFFILVFMHFTNLII